MPTLLRRGHFLGAKLRSIRKRNGLTLEELSTRCIQRDVGNAPSVSYLSMIESGKRAPSQDLLELLAAVFQRDPATGVLTQLSGAAGCVSEKMSPLLSRSFFESANRLVRMSASVIP